MVYRLMTVWSTSAYNIRYLSIEVGFMHSSLSTDLVALISSYNPKVVSKAFSAL